MQVVNGVVEIPIPGSMFPGRSGSPQGSNDPAELPVFLAGPENRLVEVAVEAVLSDADDGYSPIVFCGPSGTGKSHLAWGLAALWKARFRKKPSVYVTATDFARELADSIQTKTVDDFSARYRQLSLLVLEDVHHLAGKRPAQQELIFTLDALANAGARVVLTCSGPLAEVPGIAPGLRSRLAAGLVVPLFPPGREARLMILRRVAQARGVALSDPAQDVLADGLSVTVPELFGVVIELGISGGAQGRVIDVESARRYVARRNGSASLSLREIALNTARLFSLKLADLRSPSRRRAVVAARGVAIYLARNLTTETLAEIGQYFGGRDHTTVSYGYRKTEQLLETENEVRQAVLALQRSFQRNESPRRWS